MDGILSHVLDFGVIGILFVMWYLDKKDKSKIETLAERYAELAERLAKNNELLIDEIKSMVNSVNTLARSIGVRND